MKRSRLLSKFIYLSILCWICVTVFQISRQDMPIGVIYQQVYPELEEKNLTITLGPHTTVGSEPEDDMKNVLCTQQQRLSHIDEMCDRHLGHHASQQSLDKMTDEQIKQLAKEFFVVPQFQMLACLNWKTGSSTWSTVLMNNTRQRPLPGMQKIIYEKVLAEAKKDKSMTKLSDFPIAEIRNKFKTYWKFLTVRHPLDRLVSAYNDKLVIQKNYYKKLGPKIMTRIRGKNVSKTVLKSGLGVSFKEFLQYISVGGQDIFGTDGGHWHDQMVRCQPCTVDYDYLVRTETNSYDAPYIISHKMIGRGLELKEKSRRTLINGEHNHFGRFLHHFESIPDELFDKVLGRYRNDLWVYGYNFTRTETGSIFTECIAGENGGKSCC